MSGRFFTLQSEDKNAKNLIYALRFTSGDGNTREKFCDLPPQS